MPIWNDKDAQVDFAEWMQRHRQDERETRIREVAANYAAGHYDHDGYPAGVHIVAFQKDVSWPALGTAAFPPGRVATYENVILDIDQSIQGRARALIAEMALREQLDEMDEPGDT